MKVVCFGDSNTYGYDPGGYIGGRYDHPWPALLAEKLGCTVLNWGDNGREIPAKAVDFPAMERFLEPLNRQKILLIAPPPMKLGPGYQIKNWLTIPWLLQNTIRPFLSVWASVLLMQGSGMCPLLMTEYI